MNWLYVAVSALSLAVPLSASAAIAVGKVPPAVKLDGKDGGRVVGGAWSSSELKDKVYVVFYVDPDESDLNDHVANALRAADLDHKYYASVAIVNMDATWLPNGIIKSKLEGKQKKYPKATYVMDKEKVLVKAWGLGDDNNDVVLFAPDGKVLWAKDGKLSDAELQKLMALVKEQVDALQAPPPAAPEAAQQAAPQ